MRSATHIGADAPSKMLTIRVTDPIGLAKRQGGTSGAIAAALVSVDPSSATAHLVEAKLYEKMRAELADALAQKGVTADVRVVDATQGAASAADDGPGLWTGLAVGGGLVGLAWTIKSIFFRRK